MGDPSGMTRDSSWLQRWLGGQVPKLSSGDQVGSRPDTANLGFGQEAGLSDLPTAEFERLQGTRQRPLTQGDLKRPEPLKRLEPRNQTDESQFHCPGLRGFLSLWLNCAVLCLVTQSCPTLCNPMDCSLPGSSVHQDSSGKYTGVGCHALLQGIFPTQGSNPGLPHCRRILYHLSPSD